MTRTPRSLVIVGLTLLGSLAGCVSQTPVVDSQFGAAVVAARAQQTINPDASRSTASIAGMDGRSAKQALDRYHDSFKAPPAAANIFNIGVGTDSGGGR